MTQTAVDYLVKKFHDYGTLYYSDIEEAKAMEKEQIVKAFNEGMSNSVDYFGNGVDETEQYYNETYNK